MTYKKWLKYLCVTTGTLAATILIAGAAIAQDRVALVIGNGTYTNASSLLNPPNDAADMATALRELGFDVIAATNVDKVSFDKKIREFATALRQAKTALFFYAGHGMQVSGRNYAVPIDARLESAADLQVETVDIDQVLSVMQADENRVNLVFLDACRDNPLTRSFARTLPATRAVAVGSGLTAVDAGRGTLIAFATAPNKVALDGRGRNSPFTTALLKHIRTPGLDIAFVLRRVTADVEAASQGTQIPWVHASLTTDVMLKRGEGLATLPVPPSIAPNLGADEITWSLLKDTTDTKQLQRFLQQFPDSARRSEAEARIANLGRAEPQTLKGQRAPTSSTKLEPPHEMMPADVPVDVAILGLIENHPFFANAPAVRLGAYKVASSLKNSWSQSGQSGSGTSTSDEAVTVHWLRRGVVSESATTDGTSNSGGAIHRSTSQRNSVLGANGLIGLGLRQVTPGAGKPFVNSTKLMRIGNFDGHIFPLEIGNRFSFEAVRQWRTSMGFIDEITESTKCEVTNNYDANLFHDSARGKAFVLACNVKATWNKSKSNNSSEQTRWVFLEDLGYFLLADLKSPQQRPGPTYTSVSNITRMNGDYILQSLLVAH